MRTPFFLVPWLTACDPWGITAVAAAELFQEITILYKNRHFPEKSLWQSGIFLHTDEWIFFKIEPEVSDLEQCGKSLFFCGGQRLAIVPLKLKR